MGKSGAKWLVENVVNHGKVNKNRAPMSLEMFGIDHPKLESYGVGFATLAHPILTVKCYSSTRIPLCLL